MSVCSGKTGELVSFSFACLSSSKQTVSGGRVQMEKLELKEDKGLALRGSTSGGDSRFHSWLQTLSQHSGLLCQLCLVAGCDDCH